MSHKGFSLLTTVLVIFVLTSHLASCVLPEQVMLPDPETLFQTSTLSALEAGDFEGEMTIGALKRHGDFGLGTFNALDGEMVILDGQVYQIKADGVAYLANDATQTPFAAITIFEAEQTFTLNEVSDCSELQAAIDGLLPTVDTPYAIKISGTLASLKVRAPHTQSPPYPPLAEALADQAILDSQKISGTMVGFRLPDYMAGVNAAGYHLHFISEDRQSGGHILECQPDALIVEIDAIDKFRLEGIEAQPRRAE
jgi:acetolactate decarboxylase